MTKANTANTPNATTEGNPLALVAGGVAIGVVVGMLLPRIDKERELLAPVGAKIADRAHATIEAAKEAGRAEIEGLIPNRDMAKDKVGSLFGNILGAAAKGSAVTKA